MLSNYRRIKVLHLLNTGKYSGAENVVCQIIGMMQDNPEYKHVYCSRRGPIEIFLREQNIDFVPISNMSIREIQRVIVEEKPDVIHAHDMRASFFASCSCGKVPLVCHIHNNAFDSRRLSVKSVGFLLAIMKARHIFWVSESAMVGYRFSFLARNKSSILRNVLDIESVIKKSELDRNTYNYDVVFVGRLSDEKDPVRALRIINIVREKLPKVTFAFIGNGDKENELRHMVQVLDISQNVSFLGFQNNPLKILADAKVMLMSSRWEGLPMAALEALCLGTPIVATPTDGLFDLATDENIFLSNDDLELAQQIVNIVTNEDLRSKINKKAKEQASRICNMGKYMHSLITVYRNIVD